MIIEKMAAVSITTTTTVTTETKRYILEHEEEELKRLTSHHELIKSCMPSLILAPIDLTKQGRSILDSATADGRKKKLPFCVSLSSLFERQLQK
jgi:hypothetical protein